MKVTISKKIGKSTLQFQVEGEKERDTLAKASYFTTIPDVCGNCISDDIELDSNKAKDKEGKEFTFIKLKCKACDFRSNMGELISGGIFWKKWEEYIAPIKKQTDESFAKSEKKSTKEETVDEDEIPF